VAEAQIVRVSGPLVVAEGMHDVKMFDVVRVGKLHLVGEVIEVRGDRAWIQVYEETGGLGPGEPVEGTGEPLSVELGPGIISEIYDGVQRPLAYLVKLEGDFIQRGTEVPALNREKKWAFEPVARQGDQVGPGDVIGKVEETELVDHLIMVPPGVTGTVKEVRAGEFTVQEIVYVLDVNGEAREFNMIQRWPVRKGRPYVEKLHTQEPMITGQRVIDAFFPVRRGGCACVPGPFGSGKTVVQHQLAKWADTEIVVYVGCGERGNEMTDVLQEFPQLKDPRSGRSLMERTVMIANTSNMPVAAREASVYTAITIGEYLRDMGYSVALMADSTSRWAEALRELSGRLEELPAEEGFPAYLATRLAQFYERAGKVRTLSGKDASVTIIGAVSPPGGDFSEPVTQHTRRFTRCFWALDKQLANARHYPAINWLTSYSEYVEYVRAWWEEIEPDWPAMRDRVMDIFQREARLDQIVKLVGPDVLPDSQRLVLFIAEMFKNGFLQQNAFDEIDRYSSPEKQLTLIRIMLTIYERGEQIIAKGATWQQISSMECINDVLRAKSQIKNDDAEAFRQLEQRVDQELNQLERSAS